jgi:predicted transcriptional regulator
MSTMTEVLSVKASDETATRVDAIVAAIQKTAPDATVRRAEALRAIIEAGLPIVEARYAIGGKRAKSAKKTPRK